MVCGLKEAIRRSSPLLLWFAFQFDVRRKVFCTIYTRGGGLCVLVMLRHSHTCAAREIAFRHIKRPHTLSLVTMRILSQTTLSSILLQLIVYHAQAFIVLQSWVACRSSHQFLSSPYASDKDVAYYDSQETLLRVDLCPIQDHTFDKVQKFTQSFPFAAALPVQPLTYLPTDDGGVEIRFLRKPTEQKSGVDGGIRIFIEQLPTNKITITAKRNDRGQVCEKMFAEKAVITKLVAGLTGKDLDIGLDVEKSPMDVVKVESIFHKWMDSV